jgi:hypothetical protein
MMPPLMESNKTREWRLWEPKAAIPLMSSIKTTKAPAG